MASPNPGWRRVGRRPGDRGPAGRERDGAPRRQRRTAGPGPTRATAAAGARLARKAPAGLTGRALTLGVVVIALVLSLASPLQSYLAQRSEIASMEQTRREAQARVDALTTQRDRLSDPAYIRTQARERLQYAVPGDRVYIVIPDETGAPVVADEVQVSTPQGTGSWVDRLGESMAEADAG